MGIQTAWQFDDGSHEEPTPDGGLCLVETAIIAAGFKLRCLTNVTDLPRCFSRPICWAFVGLNDALLSDAVRQKLLTPFVTRLAYTADADAVEMRRAQFIMIEFVRRIVSSLCKGATRRACKDATCWPDAIDALTMLHIEGLAAKNMDLEFIACYALGFLNKCGFGTPEEIAEGFAEAVVEVSDDQSRVKVYALACEILGSAIKLGRHREINAAKADARLVRAKKAAVAISLTPPESRKTFAQGLAQIAAGLKRISEINQALGVEDDNGNPIEKPVSEVVILPLLEAA